MADTYVKKRRRSNKENNFIFTAANSKKNKSQEQTNAILHQKFWGNLLRTDQDFEVNLYSFKMVKVEMYIANKEIYA